MNFSKIVTTAAVFVALAGLGVALYFAGESRRATETAAANAHDRDALRARVAALEQKTVAAAARAATLEKELAALREKAASVRPAPNSAAPAFPRAAADDARAQQEMVRLHRRYDSFLLQRGLTPAQVERFIDLMFEKNRVREDVQAAVEKMGADGHHPDVQAMRSRLDGPLWDEIRSLLGHDGMEAFNEHEQSSFFRMGFIDPMRERFLQAGAALTAEQETQLVRILSRNSGSVRGKSTEIGSRRTFVWDEVLAQANVVLTPAQQPVFRAEVERWRPAFP